MHGSDGAERRWAVRIPFIVYGLLYVLVELVGERLEEIGWPQLTPSTSRPPSSTPCSPSAWASPPCSPSTCWAAAGAGRGKSCWSAAPPSSRRRTPAR